jgi:hypothetical protein
MFRTAYHERVNGGQLVALGRGRTSARKKSGRPLRLEALENRLAPAGHIWSGAVNNLWSNAGNWSGGAPAAGEADVVLTFNNLGFNRNNTNDILNLIVTEIDFTTGGYTLSGDTITLLGNTTVNNAAGQNTIKLGLALPARVSGLLFFTDHVFNVAGGSTLDLNGQITSPAINIL